MDDTVLAAMARWPDVPDVYGWLSLTDTGQWCLHPDGDAHHARHARRPGQPISSPGILRFISRNYARDAAGRWYFQNGPQRVYACLDAAPYILRMQNDQGVLLTHTDMPVQYVQAWWMDDAGRLYAQTDLGPGLVAGRDLGRWLELARTPDGQALESLLEDEAGLRPLRLDAGLGAAHPEQARAARPAGVPLARCAQADIARQLGFEPRPQPPRRV